MEPVVKLNVKVLIRTKEGKQQEINLNSYVLNPEIDIRKVAWDLERIVNDYSGNLRLHVEIVDL